MGAGYLIDTNAVIDYLNNSLPEPAGSFLDQVEEVNLSVVTRIELLVWRNANKQQIEVLKSYIAQSKVFDLVEPVIKTTINIRKSYRVKLPDAIIAATALAYDLTIISRNISDYEKIEGLKLIDSYELK